MCSPRHRYSADKECFLIEIHTLTERVPDFWHRSQSKVDSKKNLNLQIRPRFNFYKFKSTEHIPGHIKTPSQPPLAHCQITNESMLRTMNSIQHAIHLDISILFHFF